MSRPAKLNVAQCQKALSLRKQGLPVAALAEKFDVSESSIYKVLDGSYKPRALFRKDVEVPMPELFKASNYSASDDLILEAARLIVAQAANRHMH